MMDTEKERLDDDDIFFGHPDPQFVTLALLTPIFWTPLTQVDP